MSCLLSVVVPIKNGYLYIKSIIQTVLSMDNEEIELVIQDNTEINTEICEYLKGITSENIKYYHCPKGITMSENFNTGVKNSKGRYICILGSDDNICPSLLKVAKYMEQNDIDSAIFHKAIYSWPDIKFRAHQKWPSMIISKCSGEISSINIKQEVDKQLKTGMTSLGNLPEVYHGLVKRETMDKIYDITGTYIPGACPDMAVAVALSQVVSKHVYIDAPFTISGKSYNSAGGKGARGEHKGNLKDMSFLPNNIEDTWPVKIPKIWTGPTIYADSAYNALKAMGREDLIRKFDYSESYANLITFYPEFSKLVKPFLKGKVSLHLAVAMHITRLTFYRVLTYGKNYLMTNFHISRDSLYYKVETSYEASKIAEDFIEKQFSRFDFMK